MQFWMHIIEKFVLIHVILRNFEDQNDSLPNYLVEAVDFTKVVQSVVSKHGKDSE